MLLDYLYIILLQYFFGCEDVYDKKTDSDEIYIDEKGIYHYVVPHCSHYKSTNVTKHDTNWTPVYSKGGKKEYVNVKKYKCKSCGKKPCGV